jgi:hypothetical protein
MLAYFRNWDGSNVAAARRNLPTNRERIEVNLSPAQKKQVEKQMAKQIQTYDAIIVGAGFSSTYVLKALRDKIGNSFFNSPPVVRSIRHGRRGGSRTGGGSCWHTCDEPSRKSMLPQGGN